MMAEGANVRSGIAPDPDKQQPAISIEKFNLMDHANPEVPCNSALSWGSLVDPAGEFCKGSFNTACSRIAMETDKTYILLLFGQEQRGKPHRLADHHGQYP
jgi:hypothetical protein